MQTLDTKRLRRSSVLIFFGLLRTGGEATYRGLQSILGVQTERAAKRAVAVAVEDGIARVVQTGPGKGAKAVVKLTDEAIRFARKTFV